MCKKESNYSMITQASVVQEGCGSEMVGQTCWLLCVVSPSRHAS